ncbi:MAG: hypothetical protein M3259_06795 [Actinomycetota bacterium]|nr:hypothetical protein [Actinomycetota bacterium]
MAIGEKKSFRESIDRQRVEKLPQPVYRPIYFRVLVGAVLGVLDELEIFSEQEVTVPAWA